MVTSSGPFMRVPHGTAMPSEERSRASRNENRITTWQSCHKCQAMTRMEPATVKEPSLSSRSIAREAVRQRIQQVAEALFDARGYRETSVAAIAEGVGISERTFFRYFTSKDELLFSSFEADTQWAIDSVNARSPEEDPWVTLQAVVEGALDRIDDDAQRKAALFQRIAVDSPHVLAAYLSHVHAFQRSIADALWLRRQAPSVEEGVVFASEPASGWDADRIVLSAVVSSVFAAVNEVVSLASDRTPPEQRQMISDALHALRPSSVNR